jgi:SAM-dependent methyltransferase
MNTEMIKHCDLCGNNDFIPVWDKIWNIKNKKGNFGILIEHDGKYYNYINVMCNKCGLMFVTPRMTEEATTEYYSSVYRNDYGIDLAGEKYHAFKAIEHIGRNKKIFNFTKDKKYKILEIGCSTGIFLENMKHENIEVFGVEQCKETAKIAQDKGLNVDNCRIEDYNGKDFDMVAIFNTLEHMHSPTSVLEKIHSILKPDGLIYVVVPDLYTNMVGLNADAFLSCAHLFNFDIVTLKLFIEKCGFKAESISSKIEINMDKLHCIARKCNTKGFEIKHDPTKYIPYIHNRLEAMTNLAFTKNMFISKGVELYE